MPVTTTVFRECLEIALIISLVIAATQVRLIRYGLGLGFLGAAILPFFMYFMDTLAASVEGMAQDIFDTKSGIALPVATIVFRECLEIALIISLVMAATQGLKGRVGMVLTGLGLGFLGAAILPFFMDTLAASVEQKTGPILFAGVLFVAVGFLSWIVIWMKHWVLVTIVALASLREGAETVFFIDGMLAASGPMTEGMTMCRPLEPGMVFSIYEMLASGQVTWSSIIMGGLLGGVGLTVVGVMLYLGLLRTARRHLFSVTSWLLVLLTARMAAHGARYLIQAGVLPDLVPQMWSTSHIVSSSHGLLGEIGLLGVLIGYTPSNPTGMQVLFYVTVVASIALLMYRPWEGKGLVSKAKPSEKQDGLSPMS